MTRSVSSLFIFVVVIVGSSICSSFTIHNNSAQFLRVGKNGLVGAAEEIDETNLTDGSYIIQNVRDDLVIAALENGFTGGNSKVAPVSAETLQPNNSSFIWRTQKLDFVRQSSSPFIDAQGSPLYPVSAVLREPVFAQRFLLTRGPNRFNNLNSEVIGSFLIEKYWRLRNWGNGIIGINSIMSFDVGDVGNNKCLAQYGPQSKIVFEDCDPSETRQQWRFVPVDIEQ